MTIQFKDGQILFGNNDGTADTDKIAMHEDCCCGEGGGPSSDCSDCATNCNDNETISCSITYTRDGGGSCADGCSEDDFAESLSLSWVDDCKWSGTFSGPGSGDCEEWTVSIRCVSNEWRVLAGISSGFCAGSVVCQGESAIAVTCNDGHPSGSVTMDIGEEGYPRCGEAVITLT